MSSLTPPVSSADHAQGPAHAPVTLVEYGDYQCPSCGAAFLIVQKLQRHFGERLRFVFRDYPLPMHPYAQHAAEAAAFAAAHNKFWPMHDLLYKHQRDLRDEVLLQLANELGLPAKELQTALSEGTFAETVDASTQSGDESDVQGTPTFFLNGQAYEASYDYDSLAEAIETAATTTGS